MAQGIKYIVAIILLIAVVACERPTPPVVSESGEVFDLTAYLQQQRQWLTAEHPMVLKSVRTENKSTETIQTDKVDWEDELAVFEQVDLNRAALLDYYTKSKTTLPNGSISLVYNKTEDSEPLVQHLRLVITPNNRLEELHAVLQDKNPLFYSSRNIRLQSNPETGKLTGYTIKGVQKLIFSDSLHYSVDATL